MRPSFGVPYRDRNRYFGVPMFLDKVYFFSPGHVLKSILDRGYIDLCLD